jgi:hypothetical protein
MIFIASSKTDNVPGFPNLFGLNPGALVLVLRQPGLAVQRNFSLEGIAL